MSDPITLTHDPLIALHEIGSYLRSVDMTRVRAVKKDGEIHGYYQLTEWLEGLLEIADECDKIVNEATNNTDADIRAYFEEAIKKAFPGFKIMSSTKDVDMSTYFAYEERGGVGYKLSNLIEFYKAAIEQGKRIHNDEFMKVIRTAFPNINKDIKGD